LDRPGRKPPPVKRLRSQRSAFAFNSPAQVSPAGLGFRRFGVAGPTRQVGGLVRRTGVTRPEMQVTGLGWSEPHPQRPAGESRQAAPEVTVTTGAGAAAGRHVGGSNSFGGRVFVLATIGVACRPRVRLARYERKNAGWRGMSGRAGGPPPGPQTADPAVPAQGRCPGFRAEAWNFVTGDSRPGPCTRAGRAHFLSRGEVVAAGWGGVGGVGI